MVDILVIGAGPAGVLAALRAADLGARTVLVTRAEFGGMAANDGPVPVRTLAHAARLIREARQLHQYGIGVSEPPLDYSKLLNRVREVVDGVRANSSLRPQIDSLGVTVHEHAGVARFTDGHTVKTESGLNLQAEKIIICTGGVSKKLSVPGFELTNTHSDAWGLSSIPPSMLVLGAGATGVQVASIPLLADGTEVLMNGNARFAESRRNDCRHISVLGRQNAWGANELLAGRRSGQRRGSIGGGRSGMGRRYGWAEPRYGRCREQFSGIHQG